MARGALTGTRIRTRRLDLGLKQAELARSAGISASYLNLIEHNRRSIGGRLLNELAAALAVEPAALSEGAEAALLGALRDVAASPVAEAAERDRTEEFAGRFPGWAATLAAQARRIAALERNVEALSDRLTQDPALAAALHEVLSTVTAIRSTSAILADDAPVARAWQARFLRNLDEDSRRLAESSQALVGYLEAVSGGERVAGAPGEEVEAWLDREGWHLPALESGAATPEAIAAAAPGLSPEARSLALRWLRRSGEDARHLPLERFAAAARTTDGDPAALSHGFGAGLARVFRRLATLPPGTLPGPVGLVLCDGAGALTLRRTLRAFPLPRQGAGCPLWPLFTALARPMQPLRAVLDPAGREAEPCRAWAVAEPLLPGGFDAPPVFEATMLLRPLSAPAAAPPLRAGTRPSPGAGSRAEAAPEPAIPVGAGCRTCPRAACPARREPSVLLDALYATGG